MTVDDRLQQIGISLPAVPKALGNFVPGVVEGGYLYLSGQGPLQSDGTLAKGKLGSDISVDDGYSHARLTALVLVAAARDILGSLDRVRRVVSIFGMVNAVPEFEQHPAVINGCSDVLVEIFGEKGRHSRAAVGVGSLPGGISVEITAVLAVD